MEHSRTIWICDSNEKRVNSLATILGFIGEQSRPCAFDELHHQLDGEMPNILVLDVSQPQAADVAKKLSACPVLSVGEGELDESIKNHLGHLDEPFGYDRLTQMLHHCQTYLSNLPGRVHAASSDRLRQSLVGRGIAIQEVRHLIEQVAEKAANVLILGESGTGKEVVAKAIHDHSPRAGHPFVPINCGAIPADLLESELFGHEKGAFTGAFATRKGRFELAEGGTLFLDEIGDMPMPMQVKLLRVLQERVFERVGGTKPLEVNVRVIAATHRNLEEMIEKDSFREDLYYRLNVFPIEVPSLRERSDDIPLLLQELINRHEHEHGAVVRFTQRAIESLMLHKWPGNVRELSNLIERLLILHPNQIVDVHDLPPKYRHIDADEFEPEYSSEFAEREALLSIFNDEIENHHTAEEPQPVDAAVLATSLPEDGVNLKELLAELEIDLIRQALDQQDGVVARAAEQLGMRRTTLVEKMKKYGMSKE
jgi:sigma-54 specific flagellar transcriptional regulator A